MRTFYVYMLCNRRNGTLYVGVTSELIKRIYEHKNDLVDGFTRKYAVHSLVWYEMHENAEAALAREKQIKKWKRQWKLELIEKDNPHWKDLYEDMINTGFSCFRRNDRE
ncbi:MAG: GIY-YIG nuclease family protein [bacterium]